MKEDAYACIFQTLASKPVTVACVLTSLECMHSLVLRYCCYKTYVRIHIQLVYVSVCATEHATMGSRSFHYILPFHSSIPLSDSRQPSSAEALAPPPHKPDCRPPTSSFCELFGTTISTSLCIFGKCFSTHI